MDGVCTGSSLVTSCAAQAELKVCQAVGVHCVVSRQFMEVFFFPAHGWSLQGEGIDLRSDHPRHATKLLQWVQFVLCANHDHLLQTVEGRGVHNLRCDKKLAELFRYGQTVSVMSFDSGVCRGDGIQTTITGFPPTKEHGTHHSHRIRLLSGTN